MPSNAARHKGKIKFFLSHKGYGFIVPDDGGADVFIFVDDLPAGVVSVRKDHAVSFELVEDTGKGNGRRARQLGLG